jgi:imidazolonepropionase-like amidohydrolase
MKKLLFLSLLLASCDNVEEYYEDAYCIENINIIDAKQGLKENMTIIISKNEIIKIEKTSNFNLSKKNNIIDGSGKFLIPGLWDSHVHFAFEEELASSMFNLFMAYGITSVRDTGGEINFLKEWKNKSISDPNIYPRVKIAGPLIDGKYNVYNGNSVYFPPLSVRTASVQETEAQVKELIKNGVDFLKAYEMLSPEQFKVITKIAKENKLKVTGHIPLSMDAISASNSGLNSIEHLRNIEMSSTSNTEELLELRRNTLKNKDGILGSSLRTSLHNSQRMSSIKNIDSIQLKKVLNVLAKNDTWQIPTLILYSGWAYKLYENLEWKNSFEFLPVKIKHKWNSQIDLIDSLNNSERKDFADWGSSMTGLMNKMGITFMAGTDTPIGFQTPGYSLHNELEMLVESGFTTLEAIESATYNPALYFNMEDRLGLIKEGYIADLIILSKNPLDNISNTKKIETVIKNGNLMNRAFLDSLLKKKQ